MPQLLPISWKRRLLSATVGRMAPVVLALPGPARLRILNYHRINYRVPSFTLDPDVISATPEAFDAHVRFCKAHFDIITFRDLDDAVTEGRPVPGRPLIITFDDGYEDNYRYAYPVLKGHGVSATFFLVTSYLSSDRLFWWDQAAVAVNTYDGDAVDVDINGDHLHLDVSTSDARRVSLRRLLRLLKRVPDASRIDALERLDHATAHHRTPVPGRQTLTWDEAREMQRGGMEIGSHSLTHPVLSQVGPDELRQQVSGSKAELEAQLGCEVSVFSYPVGGAPAVTNEVTDEVRAAGYRFGVSYVNGTNRLNASLDRYTMKRLDVDGLGEREFRLRLAAPAL